MSLENKPNHKIELDLKNELELQCEPELQKWCWTYWKVRDNHNSGDSSSTDEDPKVPEAFYRNPVADPKSGIGALRFFFRRKKSFFRR